MSGRTSTRRAAIRGARTAAAIVLAVLAGGCASRAAPGPERDGDLVACTDPRPQICTMDYRPVCGVKGTAPGERATYSNGCSACSDPAVSGYVEGECKPGG